MYGGFIDLRGAAQPQLTFWQQGQLASTDSITVEILPEGGTGGVIVDQQYGLSSAWTPRTVDLSAYAGQVIRLRVTLQTSLDVPAGETAAGYGLDELMIQDAPPTATPDATFTATLEPTAVPSETATLAPTETATLESTTVPTDVPTTTPSTDGGQAVEGNAFIGGGKVVAAPVFQTVPAPINRTITYTYDGLHRLKSADYKENNVLTRAYDYQYDLMSNRTRVAEYIDGLGDTATTYTYNTANQLKDSTVAGQPKRTYTYDPNGNLTGITANALPLATYAYDGADRLISYTGGGSSALHTYAYNGMGDRYRQTVAGVTTDYLLDLNSSLTQVLGEFGPGEDSYYLLGLDVIGQQQGSAWSYFGYDGLGSVRQLTDAAGAITYSANYDPYGSLLEQFGSGTTQLGFTGEYTDPSGLLYLRARYANLSIGSFLTRDPVLGAMGMSASYNGYSYVQGNPVNDAVGEFKTPPLSDQSVTPLQCFGEGEKTAVTELDRIGSPTAPST